MASFGPFYGNTGTISVTDSDDTDIPVGSLQSIEIMIDVGERTEYFSADTTLREAVRHSQIVPEVTFTIGAWDVELHRQFIAGGDGDPSTDGDTLSSNDTTVPTKFNITGSVAPVDDNSQAWQVEVTGVDFEGIPLFAAETGEFVGSEFTGRGDDLEIVQGPDPV